MDHPIKARTTQLPTALIALAFLVVAVVFMASASWFKAFLTVHIIFVAIWSGGGALLTILGVIAERRSDGAEPAATARQAAFASQKIFAPAAIVVVAMGIAMTVNAHI